MTEIGIMKKLNHKHIVSAALTYELASRPTERLTCGFLVPLVAESNLKGYLADHQTSVQDMSPDVRFKLLKWLGCLALGLAYIQSQKVRHMDIKQANILVKGYSVFYSDFGISKQFQHHERTTTFRPSDRFTRMYCAPEGISDE